MSWNGETFHLWQQIYWSINWIHHMLVYWDKIKQSNSKGLVQQWPQHILIAVHQGVIFKCSGDLPQTGWLHQTLRISPVLYLFKTPQGHFKYEQITWHEVIGGFFSLFFLDSFSPERRISRTPQTCVGMLHCDSSIWTHHTDFLMITEQDFLSRSQHPFTQRWPVPI